MLDQCPFGSLEYCLNPYPFFEEIQVSSGVYKVPGRNEYLLTRYEDVVWAAKNPAVFSNYLPAGDGIDVDGKHVPYLRTVPKYDAPEHGPIRALAVQAFTASRVASYEPHVRDAVDRLVSSFERDGTVEFISEFASPLPMTIICQILGFPLDRIKKYKQWSSAVSVIQSGYGDLDSAEDIAEVHRRFAEMFEFLKEQISDRRENPRDDALSLLVNPPPDSDLPHLNEVELVGVAESILIAGNETTTHMLGNLMYRLATNEQERQRLIADPSGVRKLVEECLRMDTPAQFLPRTCLADHEIAGVTIPAGAKVLLTWGAANRDSEMFEAPGEFNSQRKSLNRQVAFGHGAHFCLGAPLARLEGRLAVEAILGRLQNPRLDGADAARRIASVIHCGYRELRIRFDPALSSAV